MVFELDLTPDELPVPVKATNNMKVLHMDPLGKGAGVLPREISVQNTGADGALVYAMYSGFPAALAVDDYVICWSDDNDTIMRVAASGGSTAMNEGLLSDGTVVGATSQAQDFGSNGILADNIGESSTDNGISITGNVAIASKFTPLFLSRFSDTAANAAGVYSSRNRGTSGSPTDVLAENILFELTSTGRVTSDRTAATMQVIADAVGANYVDGRFEWQLYKAGVADVKMILDSTGLTLDNGAGTDVMMVGSDGLVTINEEYSLPLVDGAAGETITAVGDGTTVWSPNASEKSWAFRSRSGASGTTYAGGYLFNSGTANDFSPSMTFGTANASYAAHLFIVLGAITVDELTIRVTGTSITDTATRTTSDTEDIVIPNATPADSFYETAKKWLGQVSIEAVSGTAKTCDLGFGKYWDNSNSNFKVVGVEATWLGGANDSAPDISLLHYIGTAGNTDWTYTGSGAIPPTAIASMDTDHSTESQVVNGQSGAWKRTNLSTDIDGSGSEGTIVEIVTTANKAFELGTLLMRITPQ